MSLRFDNLAKLVAGQAAAGPRGPAPSPTPGAPNNPGPSSFSSLRAQLAQGSGMSGLGSGMFPSLSASFGSGSVGNNDPLGQAQTSLAKELGYTNSNPNAFIQGSKIASGGHSGGFFHNLFHGVGNALHDTLNVLDMPRSAIDAGIHQAEGAITGKATKGFGYDFSHHIDFGQILQDAGVHNGILKGIGGFVGDVGTDPLTFVGGIGDAAKAVHLASDAFAATHAARSAEEAFNVTHTALQGARSSEPALQALHSINADRVAQTGSLADKLNPGWRTGNEAITGNTVQTLLTKGPAGLSQPERDALGTSSGVGIGIGANKAPLIPHSLTDPISGMLHQKVAAAGQRFADSAFGKAILPSPGVRSQLAQAIKEGDGQKVRDLSTIIGTSRLPAMSRQGFVHEHMGALQDAMKPFTLEDMPDLRNALEGDKGAEARLGSENVNGIRTVLENARGAAQAHGIDIPKLEDYFPHLLTQAAKDAAANGGPQGGRKAFQGELERQYVGTPEGLNEPLPPGKTNNFLGHKLDTGSVDEMNQIAKEVHGQDAYDLFNTNTANVLRNYINGLGHRVGMQDWANELERLGVTKDGNLAMSPEDWQNIMKSGAFSTQGNKAFGYGMLGEKGGNPFERLGVKPALPGEKVAASGPFAGHFAAPHVQQALKTLADEKAAATAKQAGGFGKFFDRSLGLWRNYALMMPGKALRHTLAFPAWNTYLGGVSPKNLAGGFGAWRSFEHGGLEAVKGDQAQHVKEFMDLGGSHGHTHGQGGWAGTEDINPEIGLDMRGPVRKGVEKFNPGSSKNAYFTANREFQSRAQDYWRYAMYHDARQKGLNPAAAMGKVTDFMGPAEMTQWEKNYARRVVPFYAFLRSQMPTQIKGLLKSPNKFLNVNYAQQQLANSAIPQSLVPSYFGQTGAQQTPFQGGNLYMAPDLPFERLDQTFQNPVSQLNPLLQMALEQYDNTDPLTGSQFANKPKPVQGALAALTPLLDKLGLAQQTQAPITDYGVTTPQGTQVMMPKTQNMLENLAPPLTVLNDLLGSGAQRPGGGLAGQINNYLGVVHAYQNSPQSQAGILWSRRDALNKYIQQQQALGTLPAYIRGFVAK